MKIIYPLTAQQLNSWLHQNFAVFTAPPRAYFELGFPVHVGFPEEARWALSVHRVVHIFLGFYGSEEDCCKCIASHLLCGVSLESFQDATEPIFIRAPFEYVEEEKKVVGRLAFWNPDLNRKLIESGAMLLQGALPRKAVMPKEQLLFEGRF